MRFGRSTVVSVLAVLAVLSGHPVLLNAESVQDAANPETGVRYIDFATGNDRNSGTRDAPWQHHPWDRRAAANAASSAGVHTFYFKQGVTYRGFLSATDSGHVGAPITLTVDPSWGDGPAVLAGSVAYAGGWDRCSGDIALTIPAESSMVAWCRSVDIAGEPRLLWEHRGSRIVRIPIARTPNWEVSDPDDPRSQWFEFDDVVIEVPLTVDNPNGFAVGDSIAVRPDRQVPGWLKKQRKVPAITALEVAPDEITVAIRNWHRQLLLPNDSISAGRRSTPVTQIGPSKSVRRRLLDARNFVAADDDAYVGATIWAERRSMPKADAALVSASSIKERSVTALFYRSIGSGPRPYDRYYMEGLPRFLDSPGEYLYRKTGVGAGVLILRLPDDRNPNETVIEAASLPEIIRISGRSNIVIDGLTFRFSNEVAPGSREARHAPMYAAAIQVRGSTSNIRIVNSDFSHVPAGIMVFPQDKDLGSTIDDIVIANNVFSDIDGSAIVMGNGQTHYQIKKNGSRLIRVAVTGNTLERIGFRTLANFGAGSHGDGIHIVGGEVVEVARNEARRIWGSGISVRVGSEYQYGEVARPFLRGLIHGNVVVDSLLGAQDAGGINIWMGGPSYVFNNISGNPVGCMYSRYKTSVKKDWYRRGCYGVGIYLDGQYKGYVFNNLLWGKNNDVNDRIYNSAAFNEAMGFMHTVFHNTFYRFGAGLHKGMHQHNRSYYLGNLFIDMGLSFIEHEPTTSTIDYGTLAFARNQFFGAVPRFGRLGTGRSNVYQDIDAWQVAMRTHELMRADTGTVISRMPVKDADKLDFRPASDSPVIDAGVKVFVPWALHEVVGEWHFLLRQDAPSVVSGESLNMNAEWVQRDMYDQIPRRDLECVRTAAGHFEQGQLEDWIAGALRFDGRTRFCRMADSGVGEASVDMGAGNFLIEMVVAPEAGANDFGFVEKIAKRGYSLGLDRNGRVEFSLHYGQDSSHRVSSKPVNDGSWHHVLVEVDRDRGEGIAIYIDGVLSNGEWRGSPMKAVSVSNDSAFLVGRSGRGYFAGRMDFLRISRGTLAQAGTDIRELYEWEFNGPFLRDYYGEFTGLHRDVGAIEDKPEQARNE